MSWTVDARVPVRFGRSADARAVDALLIEGQADAPPLGPAVARFESGHGQAWGADFMPLPQERAAAQVRGFHVLDFAQMIVLPPDPGLSFTDQVAALMAWNGT